MSFLNFFEKALTCGEEKAEEATNVSSHGNNQFNESSGNMQPYKHADGNVIRAEGARNF